MKGKKLAYCFVLIGAFVYSLSSLASKAAAMAPALSLLFFVLYGSSILCLVVYAFFWQQAIKVLPLSTAFSLKSFTVIWGILWGALFYAEQITALELIGACCIIFGTYLFATKDDANLEDQKSLES